MSEPLEIVVSVTRDDLTNLRREAYNYIRFCVFCIAVLWMISWIPGGMKYLLFALAGLFFVKWFLGIRRMFRNAFSAWSDVGEVAYVFDFDGVSVTHAKGFRNYEWSALTTFNDYPSSIVLNNYGSAALLIPKRCLRDGESEKLHEYLKQSRNLTQEAGRRQAWRHRIIWGIVIALLVVLLLMVVFALNMELVAGWFLRWTE